MYKTKRVEALTGFRLSIEFVDGLSGAVDLRNRLFAPVFEPLRDPVYFQQVSIDEFGVVCWRNGADLAPDALYRTVLATSSQSSGATETMDASAQHY